MEFFDLATFHDIAKVLPMDSNAKICLINGTFYANISLQEKDFVIKFCDKSIVELYKTDDVEKVLRGEVKAVHSFDSHLYLNPERALKIEIQEIV